MMKIAVLAVVVALATLSASAAKIGPNTLSSFNIHQADASHKLLPEFVEWMAKYDKSYDSIEEFGQRFANFRATLRRVEKSRADHVLRTGRQDAEEVFAPTKFADLSPREFRARLGYRPRGRPGTTAVTEPTLKVGEAPKRVDWRDKGAVTPVKNQGGCGSCWAFSAAEEIESMWFLAGHKLTELSVEQIVDCDNNDSGCNGGDPISAYKYVEKAGGLDLGKDYPYTAGGGYSGQCAFKKSEIAASFTNYTYATPPCYDACNNQDEDTMARNIAAVGPASICVDASSWQDYSGGVYSGPCSHDAMDLDHCVQVVGYNKEASTPYWIVRNSWGADWAISGYIHLEMGKNQCGVADEVSFTHSQ
eukprot:TRINITY_DN66587_c0_g5_i1.p1 TRINITY_DN66587_c0_g5~~TRINITY_DN66587_c0_g5_i1.p1  ORF type:complete len:362 (-),score=198.70 TRINITY_DN66587_c0_g5_i1:88-1173(-)